MKDLRTFPRFADLRADDAEVLAAVLVEERFQPGHVFVREGERASRATGALYVITDGRVRVAAERPVGGFGVERTLGPGEVFGHVALLADTRRSATVTSLTLATTLRLDRAALEGLQRGALGTYARFQLVLARQLAADARALRTALAAFVAGDV